MGERWYKDEAGQTIRELTRLDLIDVAPVDDPAYMDTSVATRAFEAIEELREGYRDWKRRVELAEKTRSLLDID